jgi:predicted lipoprotein with Yx(FWY)xxD motif
MDPFAADVLEETADGAFSVIERKDGHHRRPTSMTSRMAYLDTLVAIPL